MGIEAQGDTEPNHELEQALSELKRVAGKALWDFHRPMPDEGKNVVQAVVGDDRIMGKRISSTELRATELLIFSEDGYSVMHIVDLNDHKAAVEHSYFDESGLHEERVGLTLELVKEVTERIVEAREEKVQSRFDEFYAYCVRDLVGVAEAQGIGLGKLVTYSEYLPESMFGEGAVIIKEGIVKEDGVDLGQVSIVSFENEITNYKVLSFYEEDPRIIHGKVGENKLDVKSVELDADSLQPFLMAKREIEADDWYSDSEATEEFRKTADRIFRFAVGRGGFKFITRIRDNPFIDPRKHKIPSATVDMDVAVFGRPIKMLGLNNFSVSSYLTSAEKPHHTTRIRAELVMGKSVIGIQNWVSDEAELDIDGLKRDSIASPSELRKIREVLEMLEEQEL